MWILFILTAFRDGDILIMAGLSSTQWTLNIQLQSQSRKLKVENVKFQVHYLPASTKYHNTDWILLELEVWLTQV